MIYLILLFSILDGLLLWFSAKSLKNRIVIIGYINNNQEFNAI